MVHIELRSFRAAVITAVASRAEGSSLPSAPETTGKGSAEAPDPAAGAEAEVPTQPYPESPDEPPINKRARLQDSDVSAARGADTEREAERLPALLAARVPRAPPNPLLSQRQQVLARPNRSMHLHLFVRRTGSSFRLCLRPPLCSMTKLALQLRRKGWYSVHLGLQHLLMWSHTRRHRRRGPGMAPAPLAARLLMTWTYGRSRCLARSSLRRGP